MIIIDKLLEDRAAQGNPIRVGMVGAGFMGRGIARQILRYTPGMELVAIANRHIEGAQRAYSEAGIEEIAAVDQVSKLEEQISKGHYSITDNPLLLCQADNIDAIIEVTGAVEFSAHIAVEAIDNRKHLIAMNAELDGTVGPLLNHYAKQQGVVFTNSDGDQPGVILNLYRFVKGIGVKPVLCGNIKGLQDPYRNPTTQEGFAKKWGQKPSMVTSFADGSKISFEQAIVANATGMRVAKRGMHGPTVEAGTPIQETPHLYPLEDMVEGPGIVDYIVGAAPSPGVFVFGTMDDPKQAHYLNLYKLGEGPLYTFYTPYHLCHFETPNTVARAVLLKDAAIAPLGASTVEVVATSKIDLKKGQKLDGIGHYMTYGECENADITAKENLLPLGVAEDCILIRDIPKDQTLTYDDVILPEGRLIDKLRLEQKNLFSQDQNRLR